MVSLLGACIVTALLLFIPGLLTTWQWKAPRSIRLAWAPALTIIYIAVAAEAMSAARLRWSILGPLALAVLAAFATFAARAAYVSVRSSRQRPPVRNTPEVADLEDIAAEKRDQRWFILVWAAAACFLLQRMLALMGSPLNMSQTLDNIFHLIAISDILRTGNASAFHVGGITLQPGSTSYYPASFHQIAALVTQTRVAVPHITENAIILTFTTLIWPLNILLFVRFGVTRNRHALLVSALFSGIYPIFPYVPASWGLIAPTLLSLCLLPPVLLSLVQLLKIPSRETRILSEIALGIVAGLAAALCHPQIIHSILTIGLPLAFAACLSHGVRLLLDRRSAEVVVSRNALTHTVALTTLTLVSTAVGAWFWQEVRPGISSAVWKPLNFNNAEGFAKAVTGSSPFSDYSVAALILSALLVVAVIIHRRHARLLIPFASVTFLYTAGLSLEHPFLRYELTGPWYSDYHRYGPLSAILLVPLAAAGTDALHLWTSKLAALRAPLSRFTPTGSTGAVIFLGILTLISGSSFKSWDIYSNYWQGDQLLTEDEMKVLEAIDSVVPEGSVIATNAWNGSSLAEVYSDRKVLNRTTGFSAGPDVHLLNRALDDSLQDPRVCDARHRLHVDYALDFGPQEIGERRATYIGLNEISETGAGSVVFQSGDAKLLKLNPCRDSTGAIR